MDNRKVTVREINISTANGNYYIELLALLTDEIAKKIFFYQDNAAYHKTMKTMDKLNEMSYNLLSHIAYSPDVTLSDHWLFSDFKTIPHRRRFNTNEALIVATKIYFENKDKLVYKQGIEK